MFSIATLNKPCHHLRGEELSKQMSPRFPNGLDLLCCQSITHASTFRSNDWGAESDRLARRLQLTCSCFAADRQQKCGSVQDGAPLRGQAIFTGPGVWMLNSGSFIIGQGDCEEVVLFALVRKNGSSVLVFNFHLADSSAAQEIQLADLFQHSLLKEPYGAVVLCTDQQSMLPSKKWLSVTAASSYTPFQLDSSGDALLSLLTVRNGAVSNRMLEVQQEKNHGKLPGLSLTVDIKRTVTSKRSRPSFPLSFREQWLGYRDNRAFA